MGRRLQSRRLRSYQWKLAYGLTTLRILLPPLGPPLLHRVGNAFPALWTQLAFTRCLRGHGGSAILAALGAAPAWSCGCRCAGQQRARLLQLQYLRVDLSNNTVHFHVLPPVGIEKGLITRRHPGHRSNSYYVTTIQNESASGK